MNVFMRQSHLQSIQLEKFDLLIIGGGITGAGIALDAASRGLKTALIEKNDFAYGTSSRSTKLIHGGLRYLKQLEFGLVKEVGSERAIVHKLAPHLVIAEKMLLPLKKGRGFGTLLTSFGLKLYDWLAGVNEIDQRKMLTRHQTLHHEPLLKPDDVKGGGLYAEYRTDDARLTLEIMKTAAAHGACVVNYVQATDFSYEGGAVCAVKATDVLTQQTITISATTIVNAAGPWVDELRVLDKSKKGKQLHLTKGVHIVVDRKKFPVRQAIYFDVPDGRMIFAIPRGRTTYIGTTDTDYHQAIDEVKTTVEDARYLIEAVNDSFPEVNLQLADVESSWAGLRPLIHEEGKSASQLSRKDEIFQSPSGLISIAGGKLTGYRKMAERVVDMVISESFEGRDLKSCYTDKISLCNEAFSNADDVRAYKKAVASNLTPFGLERYADYLVETYGRQTDDILFGLEKFSGNDTGINLARSELFFTLENEMVQTLLDFFIRRTGMLFFEMPRLKLVMNTILVDFKEYFSWNDEQYNQELAKLEHAIQEAQLITYD
ncbi:MAG: glycerol-3-phosphate dehydrogenase/oxidase [Cyclobacteriaceae bacterium]|nr:glycerol-3-phosphate dehydrogenase/oxidase [Cyclobacteriaceae bacterium]UYN85401.1 MAG: glycerol-3-phosphate dehydrogenase/oxidase [Cyclobacteriaceae bacterium]